MSDKALTDADLLEMTGYEFPSKQVEVIKAMGLRPIVRPDGRPRITWDALTMAMTGQIDPVRDRAKPNLEGIRRRA